MDTDPHRKGLLPDGPAVTDGGSTTSQLKADITTGKDRGRVMDSEHGLSQLGTDDEAGGHPNSPELIDQMRQLEPSSESRSANSPGRHDADPKPRLIGLLLTLGIVVVLALVWLMLSRA